MGSFRIPVIIFLATATTAALYINTQRNSHWHWEFTTRIGMNRRAASRISMSRQRQVGLALEQYAWNHGDLYPSPPIPKHPLAPYNWDTDLKGYTSLPMLNSFRWP